MLGVFNPLEYGFYVVNHSGARVDRDGSLITGFFMYLEIWIFMGLINLGFCIDSQWF